jgi:iron complex transport system ATP-binding protein
MTKVLRTSNLSFGYQHKSNRQKDIIIAENCNISLDEGQLIAIIGENGIGKSTLLRTITNIQKPIAGTIFLNDKNINDYSYLELAKNLSVVLTEKLPPSNLTVFELIALGRQPYTNWIGKLTDEDIEKVNIALKLSQIEHLANKKHYEISDGQLQKVLIARALAQDTPLIILDEPTTHLDLLHKVSVLKLLKKLTKETNKCILFSTHDIDLAIQMSDEMIVMTRKNIVQDQPCNLIEQDVFQNLFQDENIIFDQQKGRFAIL